MFLKIILYHLLKVVLKLHGLLTRRSDGKMWIGYFQNRIVCELSWNVQMQRIYKIARMKTTEVFMAISLLISSTLLQHNISLLETLL